VSFVCRHDIQIKRFCQATRGVADTAKPHSVTHQRAVEVGDQMFKVEDCSAGQGDSVRAVLALSADWPGKAQRACAPCLTVRMAGVMPQASGPEAGGLAQFGFDFEQAVVLGNSLAAAH